MNDEHELRKKLILCIDDDPGVLAMLERILHRLPYDVATASAPWEGIKKAVELKPDLVLLDMTLPDLDGRQIMTGLHEMLGDVPVVFITGRQAYEVAIEAYKMGAAHYIRKPFENEHLRNVIEFLIGDISDARREELLETI